MTVSTVEKFVDLLPQPEHTLPDGRSFQVRKPKGKDMLLAQRQCDHPSELSYYLIAGCCTIEGQPIFFEDVLELEIDAINAITEAMDLGTKKKKKSGFQPDKTS